MISSYDIVIIGAGIAGASVAAYLAKHGSVCLIEMEQQPGYHSTGRSAAVFAASYGNDAIRALTRASRGFFNAPPADFTSVELLKPRTALFAACRGQAEILEGFIAAVDPGDRLERRSLAEALALCPILRADEFAGAVQITGLADIEVNELHQCFLRMFKAHGGSTRMQAQVTGLERDAHGWLVSTAREVVRGGIVVNAAGAWAGEIARIAGAQDIELQPLRRTACLIDPPPGARLEHWPILVNAAEDFYLKPDAGLLFLSPADETLSEPGDAQPDEMDIAIAVDRLERATTLEVKRIVQKWAGLRSFVADRSPVVGFDSRQPNFFWMAALGGYGIQTAPALGRTAASLLRRTAIDDDLLASGIDVAQLAPARLNHAHSRVA